MRVDKFLWSVRCYKTRSVASDAIKKGHVKVNNQQAKASREVYATDRISLRKNQILYEFEVLDIPKSRVGAKLVNMYLKDHTPAEAFEHLELLKYSKDYYRKKGTGRPTKKDRRSLEDYTEDEHES